MQVSSDSSLRRNGHAAEWMTCLVSSWQSLAVGRQRLAGMDVYACKALGADDDLLNDYRQVQGSCQERNVVRVVVFQRDSTLLSAACASERIIFSTTPPTSLQRLAQNRMVSPSCLIINCCRFRATLQPLVGALCRASPQHCCLHPEEDSRFVRRELARNHNLRCSRIVTTSKL